MGLEFEILKPGDGINFPKKGQQVRVHYNIFLSNHSKVDSSRDRGEMFVFKLGGGEVIRGFEETLTEMSLGQRVNVNIPPDQAYGARGVPGLIPPNSALMCDIELFSFC